MVGLAMADTETLCKPEWEVFGHHTCLYFICKQISQNLFYFSDIILVNLKSVHTGYQSTSNYKHFPINILPNISVTS